MIKRWLQQSELIGLTALGKVVPHGHTKARLSQHLFDRMSEARGVPLKIGQIMSMGKSEKGKQARESISKLKPRPLEEFWPSISSAQPKLIESINKIEEEGTPASLGQVHRMEMKDGRELAIKMLYPGIEDLMQQDNSAMDWLGSTFEHFKNGFQTEAYADKFKQDLALELDYKREAVRQNEFYQYFLSEPNIIIPKVDQELSGDRHLVMQWEDSEPLEDFCQSQSRDHKIQAIQLWAKFLLDSAFLHGVLYTDPNPGNFGFRIRQQNVQLVVYDYGSTS